MKAAPDWRLWVCIALGITAMLVLPPPIKSLFNGSQLFGVMIVGVRGVLGVVLGVCGYLLVFGTSNSK
jgi:hypothetical protein